MKTEVRAHTLKRRSHTPVFLGVSCRQASCDEVESYSVPRVGEAWELQELGKLLFAKSMGGTKS
jgi:hypothetical protein